MFFLEKQLAIQLATLLGLSLAFIEPRAIPLSDKWESPLIGSVLVNSYRQAESPYTAGHRGVDYQVKLGQGVFAPAAGTVHFVGKVVNREVISIMHAGNYLSAFEPVCSNLQKGDQVVLGQLIGEVCAGDLDYVQHCLDRICLHFSARLNGEYLSPLWLTGELQPARLLPWTNPQALG